MLKPTKTMTMTNAKNQSLVQNPDFFILSPCRNRGENYSMGDCNKKAKGPHSLDQETKKPLRECVTA